MRSLMMTNRIQVITRPATSGFNFPCFKQPQNVIANIGKEGHDQDWDRNRYRRKQALQVKKMLLLPSVSETKRYRRFFIYKFWGVSSAGRASVLQAEGRRFETCTLHICRLNESGESASLTRKKLGVRSSQSVLDHQYNGQNTSLRTKRYRFDSYMVYLCHLCKHRCKPCFASLDSAPQNASCYRRTFDFFEIERLEANASL